MARVRVVGTSGPAPRDLCACPAVAAPLMLRTIASLLPEAVLAVVAVIAVAGGIAFGRRDLS
jgi:hypothetical protein